MRLLIYSDLHLDANSFNPVLPDGSRVDDNADLVILAGDIDEGSRGVRWARETFPDRAVLYVCGNHEYYTGHWTRTLDDIREAAGKFDVDFLECDGVDIGGVRFLGTSLWTDFNLFGAVLESAMKRAKASMMDYHEIRVTRTPENMPYLSRGKYLSPELTAERHRGSVAWLESKLKSGDPAKTVVITHHAPHPNSVPDRFRADLLSAAYASDLTRLMGRTGLWIHGHIHDSVDYDVNGTRVVCNPRGYLHKNGGYENPNFKMNFIVEV
jgi:Icc-related predicted phosphoesterase